MGENLHDIDKLFRDSLEDHEEMPTQKVWDALDNNLDKSNVVQIKRKYNNLKRLAVALLLLLLGTIIYEIQSKKSTKEPFANDNGKFRKNTNTGDKISNGVGSSTTTTSGGTSNNNTINNAGNDSLNNNEQQAAQTPGINTTNISERSPSDEQQNAAAAIKAGDHKKNSKDLDEEEPVDNNDAVRSPVKKSSVHKTKMSIRNGTAGEELAAEENENKKKRDDLPPVFNMINELTALQTNKAEKIIAGEKKEHLPAINNKRISPEANLDFNAKNKNLKNPKPFHFNVTTFYSPQFSFNRLEDDHHDPGPQGPQQGNGREEIKKDEPHERSSSFGVLVEVPVGKKLSLQSGVTYLSKTISIEPKKIFAKLDNDGKVKYRFDCSSGYTYISPKSGNTPAVGDSVNAAASTNTLQYVGIPLGLNYTFALGKFNIIPTVGTTANFLVKQKIETELIQGSSKEKQTINNIEGMKPVYFSAFTGVSLEYNLSKRIAVNVTPSGNFALSSINKNAAVKSYPNSFGIGTGIKIKF